MSFSESYADPFLSNRNWESSEALRIICYITTFNIASDGYDSVTRRNNLQIISAWFSKNPNVDKIVFLRRVRIEAEEVQTICKPTAYLLTKLIKENQI